MTSSLGEPKYSYFYLYDLPKNLVTSEKIIQMLKEDYEIELQEPVRFRESKQRP